MPEFASLDVIAATCENRRKRRSSILYAVLVFYMGVLLSCAWYMS